VRTRACLIPNSDYKTRKTNITNANINLTIFYYKEETKQGYNFKTYPKLVLNKLKVMRNSTFIYTHCALSLKKFLKKIPIYMWFMFTHVCSHAPMYEL
jgi:hypothetical protein